MINWWNTELGISECSAAVEAIKSRHLSSGPVVAEFEKRLSNLLETKYVVACPSGTMALVICMIANEIGPGDEVIVPCNTWISTAHAPMLVGAKVQLVDVLQSRPLIDIEKIEERITSKTKAIIAVHLNGRSADIKGINRIGKKYNIMVIEDACQALLSKNDQGFLGTQSLAGCFSLGVTKLITTGQGGFVTTNNDEFYKKMLLIRNNGMESILTPRFEVFGINLKFSDILAAIGIAQLDKIHSNVRAIRKIYSKYDFALREMKSLSIIPVHYHNGELPLYVEITTNRRDQLIKHLSNDNISTRALPPALVEAPQLEQDGEYPNSKFFGNNGMYLPSGPNQKNRDIEKVISSLNEFENHVS